MNQHREPGSLIDTELAGCRIVEEIGRGGMAVVYRAYQTRLERWVAIKVLHVNLLANQEMLARFRREARAVAALRHPNILTVYDYGEAQGLAYIVMEYVAGGTLKERLKGQPWDWEKAVSLMVPVGEALAHAHAQGVIHRDIKPANILMLHDNWPLLGDFGLAKLMEAQQSLTRPGLGLGTPLYTAPEQISGEALDHRADIYALGLILYEMVTGRLPFSGDTPVKIILERLSSPPPSPRQFNPSLPPALEEILLRALGQQPSERYAHMTDMVEALKRLKQAPGSGGGAMHTTQVIQRDQWQAGPRLSVAGTGALLFLPDKEQVSVGRGDPYGKVNLDIDLSAHGGGQAGVSRAHAKLTRRGEQWYLTDTNSTNGTCVNGRRLPPGEPTALNDGDLIQFGSMNVTFYGA